ncbi:MULTISPECIES: cyclophilin-like fold protein [unclassified Desulfovibrio]|uniref:cyclophilin-like fold protein n=1 Tax=unclassified Desulfovibrio TaxID=2593640 RepID=UPI002FD9FC91
MFKAILLAIAFMAVLPFSANAAEAREIKVKVTAGEHVLTATFLNNATTRALVAKFPLTIPMMDLYSREMCYRFPDALPANEAGTSGYEVGDIVYWTPRHSFVIMYEQNGERISSLQKIGRIDGVEIFRRTGDINVTFELMDK